jgi:hypothetical protein
MAARSVLVQVCYRYTTYHAATTKAGDVRC